MKKKVLFLFLLAFPCAAFGAEVADKTATSETEQHETKPDQKAVDEFLRRYAAVAATWYLEKKCHFLSEQVGEKFEDDVTAVTVKLKKILYVGDEAMREVQQGGKDKAMNDAWKCSDTAVRDIVFSSVNSVKKLRVELEAIERTSVKKSENK